MHTLKMDHPLCVKGLREHLKAIFQMQPVIIAVCVLAMYCLRTCFLTFLLGSTKALHIAEPLHTLKVVHTVCVKGLRKHYKAVMPRKLWLLQSVSWQSAVWGSAALLFG
jgi:hypothetical protein